MKLKLSRLPSLYRSFSCHLVYCVLYSGVNDSKSAKNRNIMTAYVLYSVIKEKLS